MLILKIFRFLFYFGLVVLCSLSAQITMPENTKDVRELKFLTSLIRLDLANNRISDVSMLKTLIYILEVYLEGNPLTNRNCPWDTILDVDTNN
jgi:Leucine-rich repeat (LRR) protein